MQQELLSLTQTYKTQLDKLDEELRCLEQIEETEIIGIIMKCLLPYLCLIFFIPFTADTKLTSEIIYVTGRNYNELWITRINNTDNARSLLKIENDDFHGIMHLSVQRNGPLIAISVDDWGIGPFEHEGYLIDTTEVPAKPRKLTHNRVEDVYDIDISPNGDIVFLNSLIHERDPLPKRGIYFIPHRELKKASPKITLLKEVHATNIAWSPDGEQIAYDTAEGVFVFNINTEKTIHISNVGSMPVFSPDGKKLAFSSDRLHDFVEIADEIRIVSLHNLRTWRTIKGLQEHSRFLGLKWSPNGKYIIYQVRGRDNRGLTLHCNIAVPLNGGAPQKILDGMSKFVYIYDWSSSAYAVEPENRLTTLWGELKTENTK